MNIDRKPVPLRFSGEVKDTEVKLSTNVPLDDPNAELRRVGEDCGSPLRITSTAGCEVCILVPEDCALLGEGYYDIVLFDGCDECDTLRMVIDADCYITAVNNTKSTKVNNCGKC